MQLTEIFGPSGFTAPEPIRQHTLPPDQQFMQAMLECGLDAPDSIIFDGQFHRFGRKKSGWYVAFHGEICAGKFGDWRENVESTWRQDIGRELSALEQMRFTTKMAEAKKIRDAEIAALRENAAHQAAELWESAQIASDDHPYLVKKQIPNLAGLKVAPDGRLMAPCYFNGEISGIQFIAPDGGKLWLKGSKSGGAFWHIGDLSTDGTIYIAEGVATACTIHQATDRPVIIAFSAQNIPIIAKSYAPKLGQKLIIIADNDESGTGEKCAKESGLPYIMPPTIGMDANDFVNGGGDLLALLNPPKTDTGAWLVSAEEWSSQPASISWLVKRWVQKHALIMVHGPSGGGKTFVVLDWCLRLAAGFEEWAGLKVHPGNVIYLAGEGHHGLRSRIAAWRHYHSANKLNMWLSKGGCDLNTNEGYLKVVESIQQLGIKPDLIVVDTLHRFLAGDENSSQDAKTMLDACNWLMAEFQCSALLVHHTGVSEDAQHRARGSSAWRGALDIEISVKPGGKGQPIELVQMKSKDAELAESVFVELESVGIPGWLDEDEVQVSSAVAVIAKAPEKVRELTPSQKALLEAYRTAGDQKQGIYSCGEFVGVDREVLRSHFYEILVTKGGKSKDNAKHQFSAAIKQLQDEGDITITGDSCIMFTIHAVQVYHKSWTGN